MSLRERGWLLPCAAVTLAMGILIGRGTTLWYAGLIALLMALAACFLLQGRGRFIALLAVSLSLGLLRGSVAYHPTLPAEGDYRITGIMTDEVRVNGTQVQTILSDVTIDGESVSGSAYWTFRLSEEEVSPELIPGQWVSFTGNLYHPTGAENPDGYDFREELLRRGCTVGLYGRTDLVISQAKRFSPMGWTAALRHRLTNRLTDVLGEEIGGYAATMLLGSRNRIAREDREAFSRLGIAHILSVSGFHVGVLVAALLAIFRLLRLPQRIRLILYGGILLLYSGLCGFNQPVIRASLLVLLGLEGKILQRPRNGLHLLSAAFMLQLILSPAQLTGLSFQLSFGAMLGLVLIFPFLRERWQPASAWKKRIYSSLCAGIGAQIGILLPVLNAFQELPLLGLFINLPVLLYASALILSYWAVLITLPIPGLCRLASVIASGMTEGLVWVVRQLNHLPGISVWTTAGGPLTAVGVALLFIALCRLFHIRSRWRGLMTGVGCLLIILSLIPWPHRGTTYIQFSVGSADAAILWDQDAVWVIDTGLDDGVVSQFLHRRRLTPDGVILTHLHADHVSGLDAMMEDGIPIDTLYLPDRAELAEVHPDVMARVTRLEAEGTKICYLAAGDVIELPSGRMEVLWPRAGQTRSGQDANESSLVTRLELKGTTLLQTGDLDGRYEMYAAVPADILKMAHHGSVHSSSEAYLAAVDPQAILLSTGVRGRKEKVEERVGDVPVFDTETGGALTVTFMDGEYEIKTYLPTTEKK